MKKGKLIVLYGANNLGKSTQIEFLEETLKDRGIRVTHVKYPIYDLKPTGSVINAVLRKGKKMEEEKLQKTYVQNRRDFQPTLKKMLESGMYVIAEDYTGTGIAWGMVRGVPLESLEKMNEGLYPADVEILLHGKRFDTGQEKNHRNENDESIWKKAQGKHKLLADKYGWVRVNANQTPEKVHQDILKKISL